VLVSRFGVITRKEDGKTLEPYEFLWVECPDHCLGGIMKNLAARRARITEMKAHEGSTTIQATIPTRGLIGFEFDLVNETSGEGVMSHLFDRYDVEAGEIITRLTGTLVSMENGRVTSYALDALDARGRLFVEPGEEVYEGMIVGENPRRMDMPVNPTKSKQLTNFRAAGKDKNAELPPPLRFSLERALEYISADEYVEATPHFLRLRKRVLDSNLRRKLEKSIKTQS
jgi:GTP-binding protein